MYCRFLINEIPSEKTHPYIFARVHPIKLSEVSDDVLYITSHTPAILSVRCEKSVNNFDDQYIVPIYVYLLFYTFNYNNAFCEKWL